MTCHLWHFSLVMLELYNTPACLLVSARLFLLSGDLGLGLSFSFSLLSSTVINLDRDRPQPRVRGVFEKVVWSRLVLFET